MIEERFFAVIVCFMLVYSVSKALSAGERGDFSACDR